MPSETGTLADYFTPRKQRGEIGLPVLSVTMNDGLVPRDSLDRRTESTMAAKAHSLVEPGDIAYNMMRMWQGASGLCRIRANISPAYVVMTPKANTNPAFAAHWLKSKDAIDLLWAYSHGLTEDRLRLYPDDFLSIPTTFPALDEQRRIAALLVAWDAAIATAQRLAALQRTQFEAILATSVSAAPMNGRLDKFAEVTRCAPNIGVKQAQPTGSPLFTAGGMTGLYYPPAHSGSAIILSAIGARCGKCFFTEDDWTAGANTMIVQPHNPSYTRFLFHYLDTVQPWPIQGSGQPYISPENARRTPVPDVDALTAQRLGDLFDCSAELVSQANERVFTIRHQRTGLMNQLLTGQLRVPERMEAILPAATTPDLSA